MTGGGFGLSLRQVGIGSVPKTGGGLDLSLRQMGS